MRASCKVCELVDKDYQIKDVTYCEACKQYICDRCTPNLFKRALAALKLKLQKNG